MKKIKPFVKRNWKPILVGTAVVVGSVVLYLLWCACQDEDEDSTWEEHERGERLPHPKWGWDHELVIREANEDHCCSRCKETIDSGSQYADSVEYSSKFHTVCATDQEAKAA